jgi:hypothetical protein
MILWPLTLVVCSFQEALMTDVRSEIDPEYFLQTDPTASVIGILLGTRHRIVIEEQLIDFFVERLAPGKLDTFPVVERIGNILSTLFLTGVIARKPGVPNDVLLTPEFGRRSLRQRLVWSGHIPRCSIIFEQLIVDFDQWAERWAAMHTAQMPSLPTPLTAS